MNRFSLIILSLIIITFYSCNEGQKNYTELVNVFIGTSGDGNTFPGASMPFGSVQLSPDTDLEGSEPDLQQENQILKADNERLRTELTLFKKQYRLLYKQTERLKTALDKLQATK